MNEKVIRRFMQSGIGVLLPAQGLLALQAIAVDTMAQLFPTVAPVPFDWGVFLNKVCVILGGLNP